MHASTFSIACEKGPWPISCSKRGGASGGAIRWRNSIAELIEDALIK